MTLVHVRDKELQTSTFTAAPEATLEDGASIELEDGVVLLEWDGTASWTVQIIHAPPKDDLIHVREAEVNVTPVEYTFTLLNEAGDEILNEAGENILSEDNSDWTVPLVHM